MGLAILVNFLFFFFMSDMLTMMLTCHVPGMKRSIPWGYAFVPLIWKYGIGELWGWGTFKDLPSLERVGLGPSPPVEACVVRVCSWYSGREGSGTSRKAGQTS